MKLAAIWFDVNAFMNEVEASVAKIVDDLDFANLNTRSTMMGIALILSMAPT
jgi:hypothetical protein